MSTRLSHRIALVPVVLALAGCAVRTGMGSMLGDGDEASETGTEGEGESEGEGEGESETEPEVEPLPAEFCIDACPEPLDVGCLSPDACVEYCEAESDAWDVELGEAFATCVLTNPLCYESVESCMFNIVNPPGTSFDLRLRGEGYEALEGKTVHAWHDPGPMLDFAGEAVIQDGGFALAWFETVSTFGVFGPLMLVYIDVDDDGECDPGVDVTASVNLEWNGHYTEPVFESILSPENNPADFVCSFLP